MKMQKIEILSSSTSTSNLYVSPVPESKYIVLKYYISLSLEVPDIKSTKVLFYSAFFLIMIGKIIRIFFFSAY